MVPFIAGFPPFLCQNQCEGTWNVSSYYSFSQNILLIYGQNMLWDGLNKNTVNIICEAMDKRLRYQNDKNDEYIKEKSRKK